MSQTYDANGTPLNERSAVELARLLQRRELSAEHLLRRCFEHIRLRDPEVQAWTHLAEEKSLQHARELDRGAVRGLLHGLPLGVKDLFDTMDMPTSYGSPIYANHRPEADAASVAMCIGAGAIVVGKTVTTEFATFKPGKTRNPHRLTHTPGGSSSGSAAAVADAMVPLAFGTQTAASVIRPAAFCGIVGYKPSFGNITRAGVKSLSETLDTIGCFGRTVQDVGLFAAAMTGNDRLLQIERASVPHFAVCLTHEWHYAGQDTQRAIQEATTGLSSHGAKITDLPLPEIFSRLVQAQSEIMAFEAARSLAHERLNHLPAISPALADILKAGMEIPVEQHQNNLKLSNYARIAIDAYFDQFDVIIAPSAIGEAPEGLEHTGDPVFCRMWTLLGLPCVHVPFTTGSTGLPVGLQVIGRYGADEQTLQAAHWLQETTRR
jgi:Asp-tRNA(Asn)/Glu-tRNA(Gln) amidotransferase A subunit family amidase